MQRRKILLATLVGPLVAAAGVVGIVSPGATAAPLSGNTVEFNVLAADGVDVRAAEDAVRAAGGTVVKSNSAAGLITATAPASGFSERLASVSAVEAVAKSKSIGKAPAGTPAAAEAKAVEQENKLGANGKGKKAAATAGMDPMDDQLWGLRAVRSDLARTKQAGDRRVTVGVIDTGVDGTHPDIAPNFNATLSRNFVKDIPVDELGQEVDGPCEFAGCVDPVNHDDGAHGTHVAGTIAAAANGFGISGVAPNVSLVNIRAGQDSGYFFLQPTVDALTYAGDAGIDVVNMSFYVDPWLFNCDNNPADTPEQQAEQRLIKRALTRAMNYAHDKGVTQVVSLGNGHYDTGNPLPDASSPDYPAGTAYPRTIDNATCLTFPVEGPHAITVSALGPSNKKADYSNYGLETISVSAPGGYFRDYFGTDQYRANANLILSTYPRNVALAEGAIDEDGNVTPDGEAVGVQKACNAAGCGYYQFLQGTSMASPHATGVAALIVSQYGKRGGHNSFGLNPDKVRRVLEGTAFATACPNPRTVTYTNEGRPAEYTATCEGDLDFNGFYGHGVVDAWTAVQHGKQYLN